MFDRGKSDALFTDTLDLLDTLNTRDGRFEYADYVSLHNNITALYDSFSEVDELMEMDKAEAEGRLVVLPCKVGDMVYRKARFCDTVIDATVSQLTINKFGLQGVASKGESTRFHFDSEDIGERVFFTREAAEKALGGGEG